MATYTVLMAALFSWLFWIIFKPNISMQQYFTYTVVGESFATAIIDEIHKGCMEIKRICRE
ncbi:hypothetical protein HNQ80_001176 [Anaerosolibacter carboniphilus]|uniref:Uncharacterized protein n=1 Tax=Anaerosolibacter carboniphilus TaxID=1417629 RepID=A0A841KNT2_9FIRM|nr:hypothetical protein [Anaerosolibacter carboniphilus]MBB6215087.1 hypothetical protein [Anaerosolibacter carboniphilus]